MRSIIVLVAALAISACSMFCGEAEKATKACVAAQTNDACQRCCKLNGAFGHSFFTGSPCKCL